MNRGVSVAMSQAVARIHSRAGDPIWNSVKVAWRQKVGLKLARRADNREIARTLFFLFRRQPRLGGLHHGLEAGMVAERVEIGIELGMGQEA